MYFGSMDLTVYSNHFCIDHCFKSLSNSIAKVYLPILYAIDFSNQNANLFFNNGIDFIKWTIGFGFTIFLFWLKRISIQFDRVIIFFERFWEISDITSDVKVSSVNIVL